MSSSPDSKVKFEVPRGFRDLVEEHLAQEGLSMRQAAARARLSPAFFCRIMTGERGLPSDTLLLRIAKALGISPPDKILVEAGRMPEGLLKEAATPLLRATGPLTKAEIQEVMHTVEGLLRKYQKKGRV